MAGRRAFYGNVLAHDFDLDLDLSGIGRLLALTPNDDVNTLASSQFATTFGGAETYQLAARREAMGIDTTPADQFGGRQLFGPEWSYQALEDFLDHGGEVRRLRLGTDPEIAQDLLAAPDLIAILFVIKGQRVQVVAADNPDPMRDVAPGDTVIALFGSTRESVTPD